MDERIERARQHYEQAIFGGDFNGLDGAHRELDAVEADVALARGRLLYARFLEGRNEDTAGLPLFERAAAAYRELADVRGEAEALFWIGIVAQAVRRDNATAVPVFERSRELANLAGDTLTLSYALRHLGTAEHAAGRLDAAREYLEESLRLREELGFMAGVAANMVGLAYIAIAQDRHDDAAAIIEAGAGIAEAANAHAIVRQFEEAAEAALQARTP